MLKKCIVHLFSVFLDHCDNTSTITIVFILIIFCFNCFPLCTDKHDPTYTFSFCFIIGIVFVLVSFYLHFFLLHLLVADYGVFIFL